VRGSCTHGGDEKCAQKLWSEGVKGRDHMEDLSVVERIILE